MVKALFDRYGTWAQLEGFGPVKVFCQSINSRSRQSMERIFMPLGEVPRGQYVCYFPGDIPLSLGMGFTVAGLHLEVCRREAMLGLKGKVIYQWVLCRCKGGDQPWQETE